MFLSIALILSMLLLSSFRFFLGKHRFVDFMCELEAKSEGATYYVEQNEMDLYRPSTERNEEWRVMFYLVLMCYDGGEYTKEVHEAVLAEEEAERRQEKH